MWVVVVVVAAAAAARLTMLALASSPGLAAQISPRTLAKASRSLRSLAKLTSVIACLLASKTQRTPARRGGDGLGASAEGARQQLGGGRRPLRSSALT